MGHEMLTCKHMGVCKSIGGNEEGTQRYSSATFITVDILPRTLGPLRILGPVRGSFGTARPGQYPLETIL